jgi:lipopolysaccharide transport system permease protein
MLESPSMAPSGTLDAPTYQPPDRPLVLIEPRSSGLGLNLRDLWAYRELLFFLAWRDLKVRYKQTILGVMWVVLQPLLMTVVFTIFLGMLIRVPTNGVPYTLMVYLGLLPWTFFSGAIVNSGNSIVGNAHLITKVYFPRMVIPAAAIGARLVDFAVSFVILAVLMVYYHVSLTANVLLLPVLLGILTLLALGLGMLISALNVKYRDIGVMLPVLVQLWMYASPVVYPLSLVPEKWRAFYIWNPMVGIIAGFRSALLGEAFQWPALAISTVITVALFVISSIVFRRVEKGFADFV